MGTTWYLERTDLRGLPSPLPDRDLVNRQYERAAQYLVASAAAWVKLVTFLRVKIPPGRLTRPDETKLPGQYTSAGIFRIEPDRAVILTLTEAPARYQAVQVGDLWFNGLDFWPPPDEPHPFSSAAKSRRSLPDGAERPGSRRRQLAGIPPAPPRPSSTCDGKDSKRDTPSDRSNSPKARVVEFDELREHLPGDEPEFSAEERMEQLAARQAFGATEPAGVLGACLATEPLRLWSGRFGSRVPDLSPPGSPAPAVVVQASQETPEVETMALGFKATRTRPRSQRRKGSLLRKR